MPGREKLPSTLKRSPAKAQRTWIKTHDHAVKEYGTKGELYQRAKRPGVEGHRKQ